MTEIEAFIDYAIKERCEGCKDCDPKKNGSQAVVCMEQGFAHWIMDLGRRWQQGKGRNVLTANDVEEIKADIEKLGLGIIGKRLVLECIERHERRGE